MAWLKMVEFPTRLCEVNGELGYFHLWEQWSNVVGASLLRGRHPAGQIGQVYGIVEFKDGVLTVTVPKKEEVETKTVIEIK